MSKSLKNYFEEIQLSMLLSEMEATTQKQFEK